MRSNLRAAAKVAVVAAVLIAVLYVAASAVVDSLVSRRVLWEVDQRVSSRLSVVSSLADPLASTTIPDDVGTDGEPVFVWWVPLSGVVTALTVGAPALPERARHGEHMPQSLATGKGTTFRFDAVRFRGGLLVGAQDLAAMSRIEEFLLVVEVVLGPILLVAVFAGVLTIGLRAAAPAEAARRRLQELTADASHELRTPLTVIQAEIELARSGPLDPASDRDALRNVERESFRLRSIVEDLLWLARFDAAPERPPLTRVDLADLAVDGAGRFAAVAASRDIELSTDAVQAWVEAPREWLERLVGTLLDNACRYAPSGGTVRVTAGLQGSRAFLRVEDDGPGIPEADRELLFDRFRRTTDAPGGAGLGLAIADSVVRSTGGTPPASATRRSAAL